MFWICASKAKTNSAKSVHWTSKQIFPFGENKFRVKMHTHPKGFQYAMLQVHKDLSKWAARNLEALKSIDSIDPTALKTHHDEWLEELILEYKSKYGEWRSYDDRTVRASVAMHIFVELMRSRFVCMYKTVALESAAILAKEKPATDWLTYSLGQTNHLGHTLVPFPDWETPIFKYTQTKIVNALLLLTEKIDQVPIDAMDEVRRVIDVLYTRCAVLFCEATTTDVLDFATFRQSTTPSLKEAGETAQLFRPNRDFLAFVTIYFNVLMRRVYYGKLMNIITLEINDEYMKRLIEQDICGVMDDDTFEEMYAKSSDEGYVFPGDREWFLYRHPDEDPQVGTVLDICMRYAYRQRYFTEYRISKDVVLAAVDQNTHQGHCARIFVFDVLQNYIQGFPWKETCVIPNDALEGSQVQLTRGYAPYMIQSFSRYYAYFDGVFYSAKSFYGTLAAWFYLLRKHFGGQLFESHDLKELTDYVLDGKRVLKKRVGDLY